MISFAVKDSNSWNDYWTKNDLKIWASSKAIKWLERNWDRMGRKIMFDRSKFVGCDDGQIFRFTVIEIIKNITSNLWVHLDPQNSYFLCRFKRPFFHFKDKKLCFFFFSLYFNIFHKKSLEAQLFSYEVVKVFVSQKFIYVAKNDLNF